MYLSGLLYRAQHFWGTCQFVEQRPGGAESFDAYAGARCQGRQVRYEAAQVVNFSSTNSKTQNGEEMQIMFQLKEDKEITKSSGETIGKT